jgi:hypothetical protein
MQVIPPDQGDNFLRPLSIQSAGPLQTRRASSISQATDVSKASRRTIAVPTLSIDVPAPKARTTKLEKSISGDSNGHQSKAVAFLSPELSGDNTDDESSICQSPSWENYDLRKKNKKKQLQMKKRQKEQAAKKKLPAKLTKSAPPHSVRTEILSETPTPLVLPPRSSSRPFSSIITGSKETVERPSHVRQQSDVGPSQFKSPKPILPTADTGFLGGLKLERARAASMKRLSEAQHKTSAESSLSKLALASHPIIPPAPAPTAKLPESRPPRISSQRLSTHSARRTSRTSSLKPSPLRTESMASSPTEATMPDLSKVYKWRERTLREMNGESELKLFVPKEAPKCTMIVKAEEPKESKSSRGRSRQRKERSMISCFGDETQFKGHFPPPPGVRQHQRSQSMTTSRPPTDIMQRADSALGLMSSKNLKDTLQIDGSFTHPRQSPDPHSRTQSAGNSVSLASQKPQINHRQTSSASISTMRGLKDAAKAALHFKSSPSSPSSKGAVTSSQSAVKEVPKAARLLGEYNEMTMKKHRTQTHGPSNGSSDSSYSDSLPSPSTTTTPDTSRPQSQKGAPALVGEVGTGSAGNLLVNDDERTQRKSHYPIFATASVATPSVASRSSSPERSQKQISPKQPRLGMLQDNTNLVIPGYSNQSRKSVAPTLEPIPTVSLTMQDLMLVPSPRSSRASSVPANRLKVGQEVMERERDEKEPELINKETKTSQEALDRKNGAFSPFPTPSPLPRMPSLSKSRSSPDLKADTSFLPPLKHQPLVPPSRPRARDSSVSLPPPKATADSSDSDSSSSMTLKKSRRTLPPLPVVSSDAASYLKEARKSAPPSRSSRPPSFFTKSGNGIPALPGAAPIAKMFVECCGCKFYHDMPSKVYECMTNPDGLVEDRNLGVSGVISTMVKCPWCSHGMTTTCCAGYAAVVYLKEKLH